MRIVLDAMGSDSFPAPEIEGAMMATQEFDCDVVLTGDEALVRPALERLQLPNSGGRIELVHAPERIAAGEKPAFASRRKSQNSIARGIQLVRDGEADAFVTAGNTGAALTNGLLLLRRIRGAKRPALTVLLPVRTGHCVLLDIGANADCKPEYLYQFGIMGSVYAEKLLGIASPRVALLSNGEEPGKGNGLTRAAHALLADSPLNFVGNVEGKELLAGHADVVVTDGFTGNVALKVAEATAALVGGMLREAFTSSPLAMAGGALARGALKQVQVRMDPTEYGGAPLLGLNGVVVVAHGRSNGRAIRSAIDVARMAVLKDMLGEIRSVLAARLSAS